MALITRVVELKHHIRRIDLDSETNRLRKTDQAKLRLVAQSLFKWAAVCGAEGCVFHIVQLRLDSSSKNPSHV
jgi:hypothetical protein